MISFSAQQLAEHCPGTWLSPSSTQPHFAPYSVIESAREVGVRVCSYCEGVHPEDLGALLEHADPETLEVRRGDARGPSEPPHVFMIHFQDRLPPEAPNAERQRRSFKLPIRHIYEGEVSPKYPAVQAFLQNMTGYVLQVGGYTYAPGTKAALVAPIVNASMRVKLSNAASVKMALEVILNLAEDELAKAVKERGWCNVQLKITRQV